MRIGQAQAVGAGHLGDRAEREQLAVDLFPADDPGLVLVSDRIQSLVEKPAAADAPSNLAILGRYIITPPIFDILAETAPGKGGEIQLTDALNTLAAQESMQACIFSGRRYDVGDQLGFIEANIEFGLRRDDIGAALADYLKELVKTFN